MKDRKELRRKISAIIFGTDTRDSAIIAENIVNLLEKEYIINEKPVHVPSWHEEAGPVDDPRAWW